MVIGGGVVGTELAGELITRWPNKKIEIVMSRPGLIDRVHPRAQQLAQQKLTELGVKIHLNERVTHFDPQKKQYICQSGFAIDFDPAKCREFWYFYLL